MPKFQISEKTAALLPDLIAQAGITNPIVGIEETKTLVRFYLLAHTQPVTVRKPNPERKRRTSPPATQQTAGKKKP